MDLQAVRYAAMISTMSFTAAVQAHRSYLEAKGVKEDAEARILEFLEWDEQQDDFGDEVSIVLVSADFSQELMSSVMWLSQHEIDVRCIALKPYMHKEEVLIDIEQRFPLLEASAYQVRIREKARDERKAREQNRDLTRYDLIIGDQRYSNLPKRPFRKGLSGRCRCDSRKVVETDLEPPCGRRPPESSIAARRCVIRLI